MTEEADRDRARTRGAPGREITRVVQNRPSVARSPRGAGELQQQEEQQPGPLRRATRRDEQQQGQEPGEVERDDEGVMRAARLDRAFGKQPAGVAPRDRQLEVRSATSSSRIVGSRLKPSIIWNPALKPGPSADIR